MRYQRYISRTLHFQFCLLDGFHSDRGPHPYVRTDEHSGINYTVAVLGGVLEFNRVADTIETGKGGTDTENTQRNTLVVREGLINGMDLSLIRPPSVLAKINGSEPGKLPEVVKSQRDSASQT